jgi:hypothetical protein
LGGCALGTASFPDTASVDASSTSSFGGIQGSNYGGHAPLVNAHVFLLQAGLNGYNGASTSLLAAGETGNAGSAGTTFPTTKDTTAGSPTNGFYYVTTDAYGTFNLTGTGYSCTPGLPVYLYASGGNPETTPPITITSANAYNPGGGHFLYVFTTSGTNLAYQGEGLNFSTFHTGTGYDAFSGGTNQVVSPYYLSTTTVGFDLGTNLLGVTPGTAVPMSATLTQSSAPSNPAVVNLAVLGVCPSSGAANFSKVQYVYMNEVSTAAAAYALGGFFPAPGTGGLTAAGAVAANLSIPASDSLALTGLQNAAITADQIYDILGSVIGAGGDGETHIARTSTPGVAVYAQTTSSSATVPVATSVGLQTGITVTGSGIPANTTITAINTGSTPNTITLSNNATATNANVVLRAGAGNGTVPQTLINTVGNILANCVDSANTYDPYLTTGTASSQCSSLFADAKGAGTSGTAPVDTASAAIDIAHNPWANVSALASLPTGNAPFQPSLNSSFGVTASTVNDFSVGIEYTPAHISNPEGLAIDSQGRIWYPNAGSAYVTTLSPFGAVLYNVSVGGSPDYVAIDINGNAWFDNKSTSALQMITNVGGAVTSFVTGLLTGNEALAVDGAGNVYAGKNGVPGSYGKYTNGVAVLAPMTGSTGCMGDNTNAHAAVDNATNGANLWITGEYQDNVCILNTTTGNLITVTNPQTNPVVINAGQGIGTSYQPEFPSIDASGNAWIPNQNHASISKITQAGVLTNIASTQLSGAFGSAVDGAGNIFVSNRTGADITEFIPGGGTAAAVSVNYYGGGNATLFADPLNVQVDPSGNLWVSNYAGSRIVELLGVAAPTLEPLSLAANNSRLGSKP